MTTPLYQAAWSFYSLQDLGRLRKPLGLVCPIRGKYSGFIHEAMHPNNVINFKKDQETQNLKFSDSLPDYNGQVWSNSLD